MSSILSFTKLLAVFLTFFGRNSLINEVNVFLSIELIRSILSINMIDVLFLL